MKQPLQIVLVLAALAFAVSLSCSHGKSADNAATMDASGATVIDFEKYDAGKTPSDFTPALTGGGGAVSWVIQEAATAPSGKKVLAQTSADDTDYRFPICILNDFTAKDVDVSVRFKPVSGKVDQAGGIIIRCKDKDNCYITRANALEDNVRLYHTVNGKRVQFAGVDHKVSSGEWHKLRLVATGSHFEVFFDGKSMFTADDA